jgi:hypothetical protein
MSSPSLTPAPNRTPTRISLRWAAALCVSVVIVSLGGTALVFSASAATPQPVFVQFIDLSGRVQLEFCPTLPAAFTGTATTEAIGSNSSTLAITVTPEVCGNPDFSQEVQLYLNRSSITVATAR